MNAPPKEKAERKNLGGLEKPSLGRVGNSDDSADPRSVQGIRTKRHADQRAPYWEDPPESDALTLLERLWGRR